MRTIPASLDSSRQPLSNPLQTSASRAPATLPLASVVSHNWLVFRRTGFSPLAAGFGATLMFLSGCVSVSNPDETAVAGTVSRERFGALPDGTPVELFTLRREVQTARGLRALEAKISNYGGIVVSLSVPDRNGKMEDVVLGYPTLGQYVEKNAYFGCLIGRYGNRIAKGKFTLAGQTYALATNNYPNHLHGGVKGFDKVVWKAKPIAGPSGPALELKYLSPDGEEGYPGNLDVTAVYALTEDNGLRLDFTATTDKPTIVNLTQHSYFNLAGYGNILGHIATINADRFTPVDSTLIPTGELQPVEGTPLDFRTPTAIGARIDNDHPQLKFGLGYDHNWVVNKPMGDLGVAARVTEPTTGRVLEVLSTEPGLQFYSGNFLDGSATGKYGRVYRFRTGFCLEPQHYPDSPNKPVFPAVVLNPGGVYRNTIIYRFGVQ